MNTTTLLEALISERLDNGKGRPRVRGLLRAALRCYAFDRSSPRWPEDVKAGGETRCDA